MAECHPVGFQWVMEAKNRGAKIIHVDPRFTRTSAVADIYAPIRAGTDIAFLGGLVHYIIENRKYFEEYVREYTNAAAIVSDDFRDTEDLDGLFSGWKTEDAEYDPASWQYKQSSGAGQIQRGNVRFTGEAYSERGTQLRPEEFDYTFEHPHCVFQLLRRHYARYTPQMVEEICGVPKELFLKIAAILCENSGRERTSAFCYAVGWTQQSVGVQYIRTAAIVQLLLGNIGRPGGGILALRGHASIQGSTDVPTLYNLLPGYLEMPKVNRDTDLESYLRESTAQWGWWSECPKYMISLLKAWFGEHAAAENGYCFDYLPRLTGDHSHMTTVADMADGKVKGYFVMGENLGVGSMNGALQREGLRALDWLVVRDLPMIETAEFWRYAPEIERGDVKTEEIATEVFFFPAAAHTEKDGSFTNTQRLLQWHHKAVEPPGDCRSELHFMFHLGRLLKARYADSTQQKDRAIQELTWNYTTHGKTEEPSAEEVLREMSGFRIGDGHEVSSFRELKDDGSTACGCWIYSGSYKEGKNQTANRRNAEKNWVAPDWGWAWPANRRILYNRASADPDGKPWSDRKKYIWWDEEKKRWTGHDVPDFLEDRAPSYRPDREAKGLAAIAGNSPFILNGDGKGWLFAPNGLKDGPLPTHYEPHESVAGNALYGQQCNPARMEWNRKENPYHLPYDDPRFPYVLTTYRLTEHHTSGAMSRWLSWLAELQPEMFCEVSPELAAAKGLTNGGWATVTTARAEIET
ncbi:MAG: formate dehydrogenase, subunit alpha, partial [Bryobacterales bacterium]|nr:formate dehydrogenase, subunit alpha [Bryobacterales bacterium]